MEPGILGIAALNPCRRRCPALGEVFRFKSCCVLGDSHQCEGTDLDLFPVVGFGVWICLLFHCWAPRKGLGSSIPVMLRIPQLPPACFSSPTNPAVFSREMVDLWHCCVLALEHRGVKVPESSLAGAGCPCASSCSPAQRGWSEGKVWKILPSARVAVGSLIPGEPQGDFPLLFLPLPPAGSVTSGFGACPWLGRYRALRSVGICHLNRVVGRNPPPFVS